MNVDTEYKLTQNVRDCLVKILEHNIKFGCSDQYPDLDKLEDEAWTAVHELDKYYSEMC